MPDEILVIIVISIIAGTLMGLLGMTLNYRKTKFQARQEEGGGLTQSELEAMIERAVGRATAPLEDKIDQLQTRLDAPRLEADLGEMIDEMPDAERVPVRKRSR